ncbi:olfactomedin-like 2Ba isoform X1 [Nerophis lumbriciformis]|uniref:olfactomedin-like 2Ba isoform X1 n=1 Tax=Nerophis lumbriciformis TaxID=546530 RepID=UPI002AE00BF0|nr:olfactomedin-like protein 2A isoform X1 [Nerophis lumbriciformis]
MLKLCIVTFVVQCVLFAPGAAAVPKKPAADSGLQAELEVQQIDNKKNNNLQEVTDGQENILFKLLGDYDKVKAVSEGSDCGCKCVVRPLSRSACRRIEEGNAGPQDSYTVETIASGPECKCTCVAPPSAVDPCQGELRLKKLREAAKDDVKLATILELLEGSYYGMDLLKLQSLISNLVARVTHIEKVMALNPTRDDIKTHKNPPNPHDAHKRMTTPPPSSHPDDQDGRKLSRPEASPKPTEKFVAGTQLNSSAQVTEVKAHVVPKKATDKEVPQGSKSGLNGMIIRGVTFYKSEPEPATADDGEHEENDFEYHGFSGDGPIDLLIEEHLLQHRAPHPRPGPRSFRPVTNGLFRGSKKTSQTTTPKDTESTTKVVTEVINDIDATSQKTLTTDSASQSVDFTTLMYPPPTEEMLIVSHTDDKVTSAVFTQTITMETPSLEMREPVQATEAPNTTAEDVTTNIGTSPAQPPTAKNTQVIVTTPHEPTSPSVYSTTRLPHTSTPVTTPATTSPPATTTATTTTTTATTTRQVPRVKQKYKISWEEEDEEEDHVKFDEMMQRQEEAAAKKNEECKDTLATISEPVTHNTYGKKEGAWMKDPKSNSDRIYVTNFYYGNNLLEFHNMEVFKKGRFTNSYKLPYNWIGTGHVVYDGAFYYNRAFSRDIIKFDLRRRYVAAWSLLHDAVMDESTSAWEWRSHSDIDFALDESGIWIIYPALDDEGFLQEVVVLSRLNPVDLSMQRETTWRTGLRRSHYGNCFIVCGVLYAVDSYNRKDANLEYAFDTHTNTQMIPRMPFTNNYTYTTQIDYNPKEGVLYAWDNGHQVTYNIKFAYADPK